MQNNWSSALQTLEGHSSWVTAVAFSPDGKLVASASSDSMACIWDVRTSRPVTPLLQHARIVEKAVFSPDGQRVATASLDRTARVWDASTGQALTPPLQHAGTVWAVRFCSAGWLLLTVGKDLAQTGAVEIRGSR